MSNNLKIFALGGLHEVGKNCYVLEKNEELIIVDCGVKFLNNSNLANSAIPDFTYLRQNREKVKALFITHGHEDHIGGIPYLLQLFPTLPIYGSAFSISLLKGKLGSGNWENIKIFRDDESIRVGGEFRISFFRVTHSIPGSFGLIIEVLAEKKRIVITGDFKFDWTEIGEKFDLVKLVEAGKKGVDLLLSDSTNAEVEGSTPSEIKVINRLKNLITEAKGRVIITSFSSNVYRLKKVIEIAQKTRKKIALLGSSLLRYVKVIQKASLWKIDKSVFLEAENIGKTPKNKLIIFCTGSQGEEKAVLSRLAHQVYPGWKVEPGDSIILTSSPIMDNRLGVEVISNKLFALGAKVYENNKEDLLHASGHASQEDLKLMLRLVNPVHFMPFHGDFRMLKQHGNLAKSMGIPEKNILVCQNGDVVEGQGSVFFHSKIKVPGQPHYIFNQKLLSSEEVNNNLISRQRMSWGGLVLIVLFYDPKKRKLDGSPALFTYGFINMKKNETLLNQWKNKLNDYLPKLLSQEVKKEIIIQKTSGYFQTELLKYWKQKPPLVHTLIENN
ncbi:MAG: ribonuclease J [Candidatus Moeniiplasma glomeromycotorum]|nr:ribonuclease J [Candidatus Moeniiplasma glomeromycotorum]MCE8162459.1 ribonuclease J [Candidatus Moeniiplasma glomeromycotorum]MCE8166385.1 ribonuclease J [Candidatus Moeniiplasma glomeromycotorum]MCE8166867.1 ribonuclease J [Candidatus Moeniiplasma glomeromycotorum]